jgi:hypothetical protein
MDIVARVIPHDEQRYETVGDWRFHTALQVRVSEMRDWRYEMLVTIHEIVEAVLCRAAGIHDDVVDAFDAEHAQLGGKGEPGDSPDAPYRRQHGIATGIERLLAAEMGVDWVAYEEAVNAL